MQGTSDNMNDTEAAGSYDSPVCREDPGNNKQCILVLMGATEEGKKELIAITDGYRESTQSWRELLLDAKRRTVYLPVKVPVVVTARWPRSKLLVLLC